VQNPEQLAERLRAGAVHPDLPEPALEGMCHNP
jgi:hypothetical protein